MYGRRRYRSSRRNYIPRPMKKYSVENQLITQAFAHPGTGWASPGGSGSPTPYIVVNPAQYSDGSVVKSLQGVRKAKNFSLSFLSDEELPVLWALVYLPEGYDAKNVNTSGSNVSIYEPNQHVIMSGVYIKGQQSKWFTKLGRNLNSGDAIVLMVSMFYGTAKTINWACQSTYSISF